VSFFAPKTSIINATVSKKDITIKLSPKVIRILLDVTDSKLEFNNAVLTKKYLNTKAISMVDTA
jgi:hypothetical protein